LKAVHISVVSFTPGLSGTMQRLIVLTYCLVAAGGSALEDAKERSPKHGHHKHHKHHHKHHNKSSISNTSTAKSAVDIAMNSAGAQVSNSMKAQHPSAPSPRSSSSGVVAHQPVIAAVAHASKKQEQTMMTKEAQIMERMKSLEHKLEAKESKSKKMMERGQMDVNGPLPVDFSERFAQALGRATGCNPHEITVLSSSPSPEKGVVVLQFEAPANVVKSAEEQAADPSSKLANGPLRVFLVADGASSEVSTAPSAAADVEGELDAPRPVPVRDTGIDVDTEMPYGELEPFGREDTAQELTEQSVKESDEMVDQLERAEVAEEKRSVFRALTRLRGAAITSFDGVARSQTGNIDEYNKIHKWRRTHPLHHLADEESDISKWAFPSDADF